MKSTHLLTTAALALGLVSFATAQTAAAYQSAVSALAPTYYFKFNNGFTGTNTATAAAGVATTNFTQTLDYFGNATGAVQAVGGGVITTSGSTTSGVGAGPAGSIVFLMKTDATGLKGTETMFLKGTAGTTGLEVLSTTANQLSLRYRNTTGTGFQSLTQSALTSDTWYFNAITWDAGTVSWNMSVAGTALGTALSATNGNTTAIADTTAFFLGGRTGIAINNGTNRPANSTLDEFAVFGTALSQAQITTLYNTTLPSAIPEPATYAALAGLSMIGFAVYRRRRA